MKSKLAATLGFAVWCAVAYLVIFKTPAPKTAPSPTDETPPAANHSILDSSGVRPPLAEKPKEDSAPETVEAVPPLAGSVPVEPSASIATPAPVSEAQARAALRLVGFDPAAEAIWIQAINDSNLSAHARQDLIEDLNEDGFPDPKAVTTADLPLIKNRLRLIETLAPQAMDEVNAEAFKEAYKDLTNMYERLTGT